MAAVLDQDTSAQPQDARKSVVRFMDGSELKFRADPDEALSVTPTEQLNRIITAMHGAHDRMKAVAGKELLSDAGKALEREQIGDELIKTIAEAGSALDRMEAHLTAKEAELFAPPPIAPTDAVAFLRDQELRAWINDPKAKQGHVDQRAKVLSELAEGKHLDVAIAILRSPLPVHGYEYELARSAWREFKTRENPEVARRVAAGWRSLEWGRRQLSISAGISNRLTKADGRRLRRVVPDGRGLSLFGSK